MEINIVKGYTSLNVQTVRLKIFKLNKILKDYNIDTIIYRGTSGTQYAWSTAIMYNYNLIHVRKPSHHVKQDDLTVGFTRANNVAFVDDFLNTGITRNVVFKEFEKFKEKHNATGTITLSVITEKKIYNQSMYYWDGICGPIISIA